MRNMIKATVVTLALALPAWAGDMGCPIAPPTGGRQVSTSTEPAKTGEIGNPIAGSEIAMTLLETLLGLF